MCGVIASKRCNRGSAPTAAITSATSAGCFIWTGGSGAAGVDVCKPSIASRSADRTDGQDAGTKLHTLLFLGGSVSNWGGPLRFCVDDERTWCSGTGLLVLLLVQRLLNTCSSKEFMLGD